MKRRKVCRFEPSKRALAKGAKVEKREHDVPMTFARKIARDHLCENPRYYAKTRR